MNSAPTLLSAEKEKRFLLLLASLFVGKDATKKEVLDFIYTKGYIKLTPQDMKNKNNRNEQVWRNDLAYVRKHLEMEGFFVSGVRNSWAITASGEQYLFDLYEQVRRTSAFSKITDKALENAKELFSC